MYSGKKIGSLLAATALLASFFIQFYLMRSCRKFYFLFLKPIPAPLLKKFPQFSRNYTIIVEIQNY